MTDAVPDHAELVLAAVQRDGLELQHASARLRSDSWVVLAAVSAAVETSRRGGEVALQYANAGPRSKTVVSVAWHQSNSTHQLVFVRTSMAQLHAWPPRHEHCILHATSALFC